ncbi:hypothetical protein DICPUDRAFT_156231 [Dictyostelium purpureum]|uniref:Uncharacterized protein n=1 Tax=Dictyostelium purpureum TaxID=5786 RepID=F0ZW20_DICPU|nr:uncharacterized protein DICPUDRAFT_156231 [Dictyostelium purpureum]EGC31855.1 hypothetical protein DICPUDRAFT_156231 [Dictyostelium purpureum]|eukprot:XP_003291625.1 hypothetical protein DICPUDRAFT_156231 [Dictyostelium purpureum]
MNSNKKTDNQNSDKEKDQNSDKEKDKDEILKQALENLTKSSKHLKKISEITKENTNQYPLLDNLTEEYIQAEHLYERTPKILKMLHSIDLIEMLVSTEACQDFINLDYELEHLIETTKDRMGNINIFFKRFEYEHFLKDKDNEFFKELSAYNNQVIESLNKLENIYETNSNNIIKGYFNIGVTLFILIATILIYYYVSPATSSSDAATATS